MATKRWTGKAQAVAQVDTVTVAGTWATDDTVTLTINKKELAITIGTLVTTAQIATTIKQAWAGETLDDTTASVTPSIADGGGTAIPEMAEITATVSGSVVTLTHDTDGVPFTVTVAETTVGDGTATKATATAATGPNHIDEADNYSDGAVPGAGDTIYFDKGVNDKIKYGSLSGTLTALFISDVGPDFEIGLPKINSDGTEYAEYRPDYQTINVTTCEINAPSSGRIKIDFGTVQTDCTVIDSGSGIEEEVEAVLLKGTHISNTLRVLGGQVGVGIFGGESATIDTFTQLGGAVRMGDGVTHNTLTVSAGILQLNAAVVTSLTLDSGVVTINGTGAVAQLTINAGVVNYFTSGTLNGNTVIAQGVLNFDGDLRAKSIVNPIESYTPTPVIDNFEVVSSLVVDFNQTAAAGLPWGRNLRLTRSSVS